MVDRAAPVRLRRATPADAAELVALRDELARWLTGAGVEQWAPGEFALDRMRTWIHAGYVHVARARGRSEIAAAVAVRWDDPEIWPADGVAAGYIHLLMVARDHAGLGLGDVALHHAEERIVRGGRAVARLDAVASNHRLHRWYRERAYHAVGRHTAEDGCWHPTLRFEKRLR